MIQILERKKLIGSAWVRIPTLAQSSVGKIIEHKPAALAPSISRDVNRGSLLEEKMAEEILIGPHVQNHKYDLRDWLSRLSKALQLH